MTTRAASSLSRACGIRTSSLMVIARVELLQAHARGGPGIELGEWSHRDCNPHDPPAH